MLQLTITLPATLESVSQFSSQLESHLEPLAIDLRTTLVLAVQELLVNIVQHAYAGQPGNINLQITGSGQAISIVIRDYGQTAFILPETISEPDPLSLPEDGLGLFIIQQTFDEVKHERLEIGSRWILTKMLGE